MESASNSLRRGEVPSTLAVPMRRKDRRIGGKRACSGKQEEGRPYEEAEPFRTRALARRRMKLAASDFQRPPTLSETTRSPRKLRVCPLLGPTGLLQGSPCSASLRPAARRGLAALLACHQLVLIHLARQFSGRRQLGFHHIHAPSQSCWPITGHSTAKPSTATPRTTAADGLRGIFCQSGPLSRLKMSCAQQFVRNPPPFAKHSSGEPSTSRSGSSATPPGCLLISPGANARDPVETAGVGSLLAPRIRRSVGVCAKGVYHTAGVRRQDFNLCVSLSTTLSLASFKRPNLGRYFS